MMKKYFLAITSLVFLSSLTVYLLDLFGWVEFFDVHERIPWRTFLPLWSLAMMIMLLPVYYLMQGRDEEDEN